MPRAIPEALLPLAEWRSAARFKFGPGWLAVGVFAIMVGSYVLYAHLLGQAIFHDERTSFLPVETSAWAALISSMMTTLGFWFEMTTPVRTFGALQKLPFDETVNAKTGLLVAAQKAFAKKKSWAWKMGLGGFITGIVFSVFGVSSTVPENLAAHKWEYAGWFVIVVPLQFALIGRSAYFMNLGNRAMREWANDHMQVDPLNPDALKPLARMALRSALEWIIVLTVGAFILLGQNLEPILMAPLYVAGFVLVYFSFTTPLRAANVKLVDAKHASLRELDAAMVVERRIIEGGGPEGADAGQRLIGLVAYRGIIADAREWPLDLAVLSRLGLYLAIPVLGWVGSALVEQLLSSAMKSP